MSKSSKLRACPALGRDITPADCGEQRQSRISCPATCAHNPFAPANYSHLLEIEDRLDQRTLERLASMPPEPQALEQNFTGAERHNIHGVHAFFVWRLFYATDTEQNTFARRWEMSGLRELKNDERVLWRAKMQTRIALLEVHRVLAGGQVEAVDLLSPDPVPMIFKDRSLAGMACRFSTFLTWVFPLPHYWRLSGTAVVLADVADFTAPGIVREIVGHLGGPLSPEEMRRWLAKHFVKFAAALDAVGRMRRRQMFAGMDARFGKAVYELRAPFAECRRHLDAGADVAPGDLSEVEMDEGFVEARDWFDQPSKTKVITLPDGQPVLGRVLLGQSYFRLEAFGAEKLARLREMFEKQFGQRVHFTGQRLDDLGARMSQQEPGVNESLVPPRLLENPPQIALMSSRLPALPPGVSPENIEEEMMRAADRAFLDEPVPALKNHTPRAAAQNPDLRPKLVELLKHRVRVQDERNFKTGRSYDLNWLLRELKLDEIIFDAPPWRPPPAAPIVDDFTFTEPPPLAGLGADPHRPPAPMLPPVPFEVDEAADRLQAAMDLFDTAAAAENELIASGSTLLDDVEELTLETLTDNDICFAIPFLLQCWFALVPCGCRAPEIDFDRLEATYLANLRQLQDCAMAPSPKKMETFLLKSPQPGMMLALLGGFLEAAATAPKQFRPSPAAQPVILALLKSIIETLDASLRPK